MYVNGFFKELRLAALEGFDLPTKIAVLERASKNLKVLVNPLFLEQWRRTIRYDMSILKAELESLQEREMATAEASDDEGL